LVSIYDAERRKFGCSPVVRAVHEFLDRLRERDRGVALEAVAGLLEVLHLRVR